MISDNEYLVSYGKAGDFGRFRSAAVLSCRRGAQVIIRSENGLELGTLLCAAGAGHAPFLSRTAVGELVRMASREDLEAAEVQRRRGQKLFDDACRLVADMSLPLAIVDADMVLDGNRGVIYHLCREECDYRPLVSTLARTHDVLIIMQNLAEPVEEEHADGGCGKPGCGQANGDHGCSTCGTGGGCSTCGKGVKKEDVTAHLLGLRQAMEQRARTPLL